ncbi:hypothetical protein PhCBS80983_g05886 [Powellomyces hirtus]|uniref:Retrotransposon gag domain-containing protein n=1 Tax=Powellomyces hirtus TaxID=109895 RepID=A0A507DTH7_9FUNG|nr:hypothetical protein PhCBS80983_g05886 [Powellomyces hirtus]
MTSTPLTMAGPNMTQWQSVLLAFENLRTENAELRDAVNQTVTQILQQLPPPWIASLNQKSAFPTSLMIRTIGTFLTGTAQSWLAPLVERYHEALTNLDDFLRQMQAVFGDPDRVCTSETKLQNLRQLRKTATEYVAEFRQLL